MKLDQAFPSRYLKPDDIPDDRDLVLTIAREVSEDVGIGENVEKKHVLYFKETQKKLPLNKTNWVAIEGRLGDSDNWGGKTIALFVTEVSGPNGMTLGIRVRLKAPTTPPEPTLEAPF